MATSRARASSWDLTALLNAADPKAGVAERHLWLVRLLEWLRHAPVEGSAQVTPTPVLRLKHLLGVLDRHPEHQTRVAVVLRRFWREVDNVALLADFGFAPRMDLWGELLRRIRTRVLPLTPATTDLGELFALLFPHADDADWLLAIDDATLARVRRYVSIEGDEIAAPGLRRDGDVSGQESRGDQAGTSQRSCDQEGISQRRGSGENGKESGGSDRDSGRSALSETARAQAAATAWRVPFLDAIVFLASAVRSSGFAPELRQRMSPELLTEQPFRQLARVAEQLSDDALAVHLEIDAAARAALETTVLQQAQYLRALLEACRRCAASVHEHLEAHGVSVDVVFEVEQLQQRTHRIDSLLTCVISPDPAREIAQLLAELVRTADERRSLRQLMSRHYSLLARKVAERSAETGQHYITRDRPEYHAMLRAAAGGGAVLAGTTLLKFGILAIALSAFWSGFVAGLNYAVSFVVVQLLNFTVATKQPAMTAPAMADKLTDLSSDAAVEGFVDEVAQLIRSQAAGIFGNLMAVTPIVLAVQFGCRAIFGAPLVGHRDAIHVLGSLTLLGPTAFYAAFTGVLLFASSLIAGWVENWFVWHRLDSAIAWNPRIVARLGTARSQRWGAYWRTHISGFASNISLGFMLGVVPVVALFFGLPIEVRHVTLSTGQIAAAVGAEGFSVMRHAPFWWCVAAIPVTALLNLGVSFFLAYKVALRSRGIRLADRSRIYRAIRSRLRREPLSFLRPPR